MLKYPHVEIRKAGKRYRVRWYQNPGSPLQRAIVPSRETADAIRAAIADGRDGWEALAAATQTVYAGPIHEGGSTHPVVAILEAEGAKVTTDEAVAMIRQLDNRRRNPTSIVNYASRGGSVAASRMTPEQRSERARKAVATRWARERAKHAAPGPEAPDDAKGAANG